MYPIVLWSVEVIHFTKDFPLVGGSDAFEVVVGRSA